MTNQTQNLHKEFMFTKYLSILTGIFCIFFTLPTILLKRSIVLPECGVIPISILFTGTYFVLLDIITEVYGYFEAKKTLYSGIIVYTIFAFIMGGIISIHQKLPPEYTIKIIENSAYTTIFNNIYVTWIAVVVCTLVFDTFNIRLMSKWKFLFKGKYFIPRSITSSSFAIILFSLITNFFAFHNQIFAGDLNFYLKVNLISISAKIISLVIFAIPSLFIIKFLKNSEQLDITHNINIWLFNKER